MTLHHLAINLQDWLFFCRLREETINFVFNCRQHGNVNSKVCKELPVIPDLTFLANFQEKLFTQIKESQFQVDMYNAKVKQLREEVKATLIACGPCDLTDLLPYLEEGNQDQIVALQTMLQWVYPNGKSCCNKNPIGSASSQKIADDQNTPSKSLNTSCDSTILDTVIPKRDSTKMDLEIQDRKQNPMPKKTMTPRYKFKRTKKGGKAQKIQFPGVHKMKSRPHRNKRIYWSKKLWYANNISHDSNPSTLHKFCPMVTSNINGLLTVIHSQNMWLLRRPRVKIK